MLATGLWILLSIGFSLYVSHFGRYNETYGTLGAGAVLLLWFWLSSIVIIVGAEVNAVWAIEPSPAPLPGDVAAVDQPAQQQSDEAATGSVGGSEHPRSVR